MVLGLLSLIAACLCWSLVFIIPLLLDAYSPIEIALGRFFSYGLISFVIFYFTKKEFFQKKHIRLWLEATLYGFASTVLCFTSMVLSIRFAGSAMTALNFADSPDRLKSSRVNAPELEYEDSAFGEKVSDGQYKLILGKRLV